MIWTLFERSLKWRMQISSVFSWIYQAEGDRQFVRIDYNWEGENVRQFFGQKGQYLEQKGQYFEQKWQYLEQKGQYFEQKGPFFEQKWQYLKQKGQLFEQKGQFFEQKGAFSEWKGDAWKRGIGKCFDGFRFWSFRRKSSNGR